MESTGVFVLSTLGLGAGPIGPFLGGMALRMGLPCPAGSLLFVAGGLEAATGAGVGVVFAGLAIGAAGASCMISASSVEPVDVLIFTAFLGRPAFLGAPFSLAVLSCTA